MEKNAFRGIVFLVLFAALAYIAMQLPVFALAGVTGKSFTLFEFFGPVAGAFIGAAGVAAVGIAKLANAAISGSPMSLIDLAKMTPMMFAAYYFWKNGSRGASDRLGIIVPAAAMLAFWLNPVGQQAWFYALYWLIPIAAKFLPDRLVLRSLGATFTAHAVGSVLFLYTIPTAPALWLALIPVVAVERGAFALGISAGHIIFTNVMNAADRISGISKYVNVEKQYVLRF
ncbi:hypothetical protein L0Y65_04335 [Candidatus Micrarchaeota archaeon]|nr:hypothetical protein [Candidatus Micrarchaeota archaeon]